MSGISSLQIAPTPGSPLSLLGTLVLLSVLFAVTAHVAARFVLGDVPYRRALLVGPIPAVITLALQQYPTAVMIVVGIVGDFLVITYAYEVRYRIGGLITVVHYTVTVLASLVIANLLALLSTAPG